MGYFANTSRRTGIILRLCQFAGVALFCLCSIPQARAEATLFLEEPYSYDGALAGTGHAAVYLSGVCAKSPVELRPCAPGELGIVLSRYHHVSGYDWIAIPLIPYLYAVEKQEDIPLFADKKMVAFLRDRYRREHLESIVPDLPDGAAPDGNWYELVGASYLRTIYAYGIETTPLQDAALIRRLNSRPNRDHYNLITSNCADFVREIIDFYHPHAVHRSLVVDLGVTTPKQLARTLSKYGRHHRELQTSIFVIPQVPGTLARSKPVHGVLECALTAKKYMLPLFALHPYIAGSLIAGYLGHGRFNPSQNAMILDSTNQLDVPPSRADRRNFQGRLEEILQSASSSNAVESERHWASSLAAAEPAVDAFGEPALQVRVDGEIRPVGDGQTNILRISGNYEFAAGLVEARLREELKSATARKAARSDVENDLALLQQLLARESPGSTHVDVSATEVAPLTQPTDQAANPWGQSASQLP